jgi:hypothetical protein
MLLARSPLPAGRSIVKLLPIKRQRLVCIMHAQHADDLLDFKGKGASLGLGVTY